MDYIKYDKEIKNSLNTLAPYVGKIRISLAHYLIEKYRRAGDVIYDPFAGSGTILLEGWVLGHAVVGNDLNYYSYVLTMGKINPFKSLGEAESKLSFYKNIIEEKIQNADQYLVPDWVKCFFHEKTLKEICCWTECLKNNNEWFLLSCLLGILHHQRPGFLSFPASNGAPYLRDKKYPISEYPKMYEYKNVYEKLKNKVRRSYKNTPTMDFSIPRKMYNVNANDIHFEKAHFGLIITSPPYMKALSYARDNRLRLWFLGVDDWKTLDTVISPERNSFINLMINCFSGWSKLQYKGDRCVLIIGDMNIKYSGNNCSLSDVMIDIAKDYYRIIETYQDPIPETRKVVKGNDRIKREIILVFERK